MNLDKLTNKQLVGLLKGDIKPTLSIKDDGKTVVVTDASGKKYTIKFKCDVLVSGKKKMIRQRTQHLQTMYRL